MPRQGRELEKLVATLENLLGETNIEVKSPDYIMGINSGSRREVDISLRTRVGSSDVLIVLETRDRNETDDVRWIEQLATKREDVLASKIVAVSSSGFTEGAKNTAKRLGIELRAIEDLTLGSIAEWFRVEAFQVFERRGQLLSAEIRVNPDQHEFLKKIITEINVRDPFLIHFPSGKKQSILQVWKATVNQSPQMFDNIEPNGEAIHRAITVKYPNPETRYRISTSIGEIPVIEILFVVILSITLKSYPTSGIVQYSNVDGETIAQSVKYSVNIGGKAMNFTIHKIEQKTNLVLSVEQLDNPLD